MSDVELKACPFCGGPAAIESNSPRPKMDARYSAYCKACSLSQPPGAFGSKGKAAKHWNNRTDQRVRTLEWLLGQVVRYWSPCKLSAGVGDTTQCTLCGAEAQFFENLEHKGCCIYRRCLEALGKVEGK